MFKLLIIALALIQLVQCHKTLVIGHRGASGYVPEHTLEAKVAAMLMGADYIEQDVVMTQDDIPIVVHDIYLDEVTDVAVKFPNRSRVINGQNRFFVIDFTLAEIKSLKVTERFHHGELNSPFFVNRFPIWQSTFAIHTLEEEIQLIKGFERSYNNIHGLHNDAWKNKTFGVHVELKRPDFHTSENKKHFSKTVLDIVNKFYDNSKKSQVFIQCFDPEELKRIKDEIKSEMSLIQLLEPSGQRNGINYTYWNSMDGLRNISKFANGIGPYLESLVDVSEGDLAPSQFYKNAKSLNLLLHPWTFRVDKLPDFVSSYDQLLDYFVNVLKVDGLFTDFPDITSQFVRFNSNSGLSLRFNLNFCFILVIFCFLTNKWSMI